MTKPLILLVDDNQDIMDFISQDLASYYNFITALNGEKALEILLETPVSLVISDVMMPVMDGFELCKKLKGDLDYSHIPLILLTAKNTLKSKITGLESGADAYIEKPFSPEHLHVQMENLIANRKKIKDYFAKSPLVHINTMAYSKADERFLEKLNATIDKNLSNVNLDVDELADIMNMSRSTLYRKIKAISDLTPNELINITRLKKAAEMLNEGNHKIYEISNAVGFCSQTYFGRNFLKQFGLSPSDYIRQKQAERG